MPGALTSLFDENAETYDAVNTAISLGLDGRWRRWAARQAVSKPGARVLDAFAGSGAVGLIASELGADVTLADASPGMLSVAERKARRHAAQIRVVRADLTEYPLPFEARSFDSITVVFGVRYLDDPVDVLHNLAACLVPGGRMIIVEFVEPPRTLVSALPSAYFFHGIPRIAPHLGGRGRLHDTLVETTHALGTADELIAIVRRAGLTIAARKTMGFGMVAGLVCVRSGQVVQPDSLRSSRGSSAS